MIAIVRQDRQKNNAKGWLPAGEKVCAAIMDGLETRGSQPSDAIPCSLAQQIQPVRRDVLKRPPCPIELVDAGDEPKDFWADLDGYNIHMHPKKTASPTFMGNYG